jgi:hypothetical protein
MPQNQIDFTDAEIAAMLAARRARMINHWEGIERAIRARYGHWSSAERRRMLDIIKGAECYIEKARKSQKRKEMADAGN